MASPSAQALDSPARFPTEPVPGRPKHPVRAYFTSDEGKSVKAGATCNYCGLHLTSSKVDTLQNHIFSCPHAPKDARAELEARRADMEAKRAEMEAKRVASSPAPGDAGSSRKKSTLQRPRLSGPHTIRFDAPAAAQRKWSLLLCRFLVLSGVPFAATDHPAFRDLMQAIAPGWQVPGAQILMNEYLSAEYLTAIAQQSRLLTENFQHATLCIDRYIGNAQQFLYSIVVQRPDGKAALLDIVNLAEMRFAAEQLRDVVVSYITQSGPVKLGGVVTPSTAALKQMSKLLIQVPSCRHMLPLRCMATGFGLTAKALMSHPWAASLIGRAQQLVLYVQSSTQLSEVFEAQRQKHGVTTKLASACATQLDSASLCVQSVWDNRRTFLDIGQMPVSLAAIVGSFDFWKNLEVLVLILGPISGVFSALRRGKGTLSDITRHFLILARSIHFQATAAPPEYGTFCFAAFAKHWQDMDGDLCQLALFLDPRFKTLACARDWDGILRKALSILKLCGYNLQSLLGAKQLLLDYRDSKPPFHSQSGIKKSSEALLWWKGLNLPPDNPLKALVVRLFTIRPFAANVEDTLSSLAWITSPLPVEPQPVQQLKVLETLKMYYANDASQDNGNQAEDMAGSFSYVAAMGAEVATPPLREFGSSSYGVTSAESLELLLNEYHRLEGDPPSVPGSFAGGVLFGIYNLELPALDPNWIPQALPPPECNLTGDGVHDEDIDIEAILAVERT